MGISYVTQHSYAKRPISLIMELIIYHDLPIHVAMFQFATLDEQTVVEKTCSACLKPRSMQMQDSSMFLFFLNVC